MWQKDIAETLELAESNVSRSIKALIAAGLLSDKLTRGHKDCPIWRINPKFEQMAKKHAERLYEKVHGRKPPNLFSENELKWQLKECPNIGITIGGARCAPPVETPRGVESGSK